MNEQIQTVWLTLSDGTRAGFVGKAIAWEGDERLIESIAFSPPEELPDGCVLMPVTEVAEL